jgi:hypothetical protein
VGEFTTRGLFLGLDDRAPLARIALEPQILIETTAPCEGLTFQISEAFIMRLPFIGSTQETQMTGLIDAEEVFDRLAVLLATVECLLVLGIGGAVDRAFRTIMPTRGARTRPSSVQLRAAQRTRRPCGLVGALGGLRPDSTRHAGDASTCSHAIGTRQRAALALLE